MSTRLSRGVVFSSAEGQIAVDSIVGVGFCIARFLKDPEATGDHLHREAVPRTAGDAAGGHAAVGARAGAVPLAVVALHQHRLRRDPQGDGAVGRPVAGVRPHPHLQAAFQAVNGAVDR